MIDYLIIPLDSKEKVARVKALPNCNRQNQFGQKQSLYSIQHDTHHLRKGMREAGDRMYIPTIEDIPKVKLLLSLGLSKEEIQEILNE